MIRTILGVSLAVALLGAGGDSAANKWGPEHVGKIPFVIGWEKGIKEAEFTGKPMFVFFTATW